MHDLLYDRVYLALAIVAIFVLGLFYHLLSKAVDEVPEPPPYDNQPPKRVLRRKKPR